MTKEIIEDTIEQIEEVWLALYYEQDFAEEAETLADVLEKLKTLIE